MKDEDKTKEQLINELVEIRRQVAEFKASETQLKQVEEALRESEALFRAIFEGAAIGMALVDMEGRPVVSNPALEDMLGYSGGELRNMVFTEFTHPEDATTDWELFKELIEGKRDCYQIEKRYYRKDGRLVWGRLTVSLIRRAGGKPHLAIGMVEDITERKRAEKKIREQAELLDKAQEAIFVRDFEHRIIYWNKGAERLYGWTQEEAIGKNSNQLLYSPQLIEAQKSVMEKGEWAGELHQITKDGRKVIVESRWSLVRDSEENPKSILVVNTDITEKKRLEARFLRAQRMESIGILAGGIAHDFNNILTPIMMSLGMLRQRFTDEKSQNWINTIEVSAQRGANLVNQILSFVRGTESGYKIFQIRHLIFEIEKIVREIFPKSTEIQTYIPKDLWTVSGDPTQLHQVLMNLCVNAHDAMPNGGILSISAENFFIDENHARMNIDARVGPYVVITISDTGVGIPSEIIDRIFEPFFTTKEVGKGTGLGLSIALGIVKSHGGFIHVYSEVGKGTEFKVYLPAIETTKEVKKAEEREGELFTGHGELILVVDDEASIREITKVRLEANGYKVITANDGIEAIALYLQNKEEIKVVLLDMVMPVKDGPTVIRELRKIDPLVKIIGVSGLEQSGKIDEITKADVRAFLSKPYTAETLLKTLHEVINAK
jgi:PAS domain S-box-containing protein